jgi:hypothetical protein
VTTYDQFHTPEGDLDPLSISADIEKYGTAWAQARADADALEKTTPSYRAELTNNIRRDNPKVSRKEAEDMAIGSPDFRAHLLAGVDARHRANVARVKYDSAQARFEALRSVEATRRTEMNTISRR